MNGKFTWGQMELPCTAIYPSKEEVEYSEAPVFTLAVAASHWAAAHGYAVMRISSASTWG